MTPKISSFLIGVCGDFRWRSILATLWENVIFTTEEANKLPLQLEPLDLYYMVSSCNCILAQLQSFQRIH